MVDATWASMQEWFELGVAELVSSLLGSMLSSDKEVEYPLVCDCSIDDLKKELWKPRAAKILRTEQFVR